MMKNKEKYYDEIIEIVADGHILAVGKTTGPAACSLCILNSRSRFECERNRKAWLEAEYEPEPAVDWSNVPIDTKVLVRQNEMDYWVRRYFAGVDDHGQPLVFDGGATSFSVVNKNNVNYYGQIKLYEEDSDRFLKGRSDIYD